MYVCAPPTINNQPTNCPLLNFPFLSIYNNLTNY